YGPWLSLGHRPVDNAFHGVKGMSSRGRCSFSVELLFFRQQPHHMEETLETNLGSLPGCKRPAVKAFPGSEIPFASHTKEAATPKWGRCVFARPALNVHVFS